VINKIEYWIFNSLFKMFSRLVPEPYAMNVIDANWNGLTYLPDIHGKYGLGSVGFDTNIGLRSLTDTDVKGRWSLGWRPEAKISIGRRK
jgi:hypothetical protein